MTTGYKHLFSRALEATSDRLHFAAHSHHYWPDAALEGHARAAELAVQLADEKWSAIFADVLPAARRHLASMLGLPDPSSLAFAPNTHELVARAVSSIEKQAPLRVLSTDSEFHSFERQARRWEEAGRIEVVRVPTEPFDSFDARWMDALRAEVWDLVYVSQVFFNSGFAHGSLEDLVEAVRETPDTMVIVDGYHGFGAFPTDLSTMADRIFYTSGGYKYAMAGEGCCFMHCPDGFARRPVNTGWFAGFGELAQGVGERVGYAADGMRMMGATFDPSGWFRFNAVWDRLTAEGIGVSQIHAHIEPLQRQLVELLRASPAPALERAELLPPTGVARGHFLTYRTERAGEIHKALRDRGVLTDYRGDRLRFGFGLYHDAADVASLARILAAL